MYTSVTSLKRDTGQIVPECNEKVRTRQTHVYILVTNGVIFSPLASDGHR